jgi:hypothetical protein
VSLNPKLTPKGEDLLMEWTPDLSGQGYRFYVDGKAVARTFKPATSETTFHKADANQHSYGIQKMDVVAPLESVIYPTPTDPPDPPAGDLPAIISAGGIYSGTRTGSVQIRTDQPVTIRDSAITNTTTPVSGNRGAAYLIDAIHPGAHLTVERTKFVGGFGQAIVASGYRYLHVQNCEVEKTWGLRLNSCQDGATARILQNKFLNMQRHAPTDGNGWGWTHAIQFADSAHRHSVCEVGWNQFENRYGESWCEDVISFYKTGKGHVYDNGIRGAYPTPGFTGNYSGGGIMAGDYGGGDTLVERNIVVGALNYCFGILGGSGSRIINNKGVNDGRTDAGVWIPQISGNLGIQIFASSNAGSFTNNVADGNSIGALKENGSDASAWLGNPGNGNDIRNTQIIRPVNKAMEDTVWQEWLAKVAAAGIVIGA